MAIHKQTKKRWAIKSISKAIATGECGDGFKKTRSGRANKFCRDVLSEVENMFLLGGHDNIIQLHEVYEDEKAVHLIMVRP